MSEVAQKYRDELPKIKEMVNQSYKYMKDNYKRFNDFREYIFRNQLTPSLSSYLESLDMPQLQFNVLSAYIDRQLGEFSKQEPSAYVMRSYGATAQQISDDLIQVIQDHYAHILDEARKDSVLYNAYKTLLSGGFGVFKIWTDYVNEMSFDQEIRWGLPYACDMCGFDPLATKPHKGDGRFVFESYPKTKKEFEAENPNIDISSVKFEKKLDSSFGDFHWSYKNKEEKEILLVVDYYIKKKKRVKIVKLAPNVVTGDAGTMTIDKYEEFIEKWKSSAISMLPPAIVGKPRWTNLETICRYRCIENEVLEYVETDYPILPLIFYGNSDHLRSNNGTMEEVTIPYGYYAKGMQDLKNYSGNTLVNELQNMIQSKYVVAEEALPSSETAMRAYLDVQTASLLTYKAFSDKNPDKVLPPPSVINRQVIPPTIENSFASADNSIQAIMGTYDAALGINDNQLSGVAIQEGATQSNVVGMPYVNAVMQGLNRVFEGMLKMFPKYYKLPRSIPVLDKEGKRSYQPINTEGGLSFDYDQNSLQVRVEAGVNYEIQRRMNMALCAQTAQAFPVFAQFMGEKGLGIIADNLPLKGIENLKDKIGQYEVELQQQKAQMQQMQAQQAQQNPLMLKVQNERMEIQRKAHKDQQEAQIDAARLGIDQQNMQTKQIQTVLQAHQAHQAALAQIDKAEAEKTRAAVDLAMSHNESIHNQRMDHMRYGHEVVKTALEHVRHEASESKKQEATENDN
jgi:hypothetical protein